MNFQHFGERWRRALDPLAIHLGEALIGRRGPGAALSFGESLEGTREILLVGARDLVDLLAIVPAARGLRRRFCLARVHVVATPRCAEVLGSRPEVSGVIPWPEEPVLSREFAAVIPALRRHAFDVAVATDPGQQRRARLLVGLSGARLRVGVHPDDKDPTLNLVISAAAHRGYRPTQSLEFLSFLRIPREDLRPGWEIPVVDRQYATRLLELRRRGRQGWLLGVDPGQGLGGARPSPEKLAWLVDRLAVSRGAIPVVLSGDLAESSVEDFKKALKSRPLEVARRGLRDVFAFASGCDLFLSGNTALFHFAVALGIPTIGILGPDEDPRWVPAETSTLRTPRWRRGERIVESEFLRLADSVRRARPESPPSSERPAALARTARRAPGASAADETD